MSYLKRIQYNCKKATFLIEKKMADRITFREHIELRIHLMGCSVCNCMAGKAGSSMTWYNNYGKALCPIK